MKGIYNIFLLIIAILGFHACGDIFDLDAPEISQDDIDGYLSLTTEIDSSTLNPRIILTAKIPEKIDDHEKRNIIFSSDKGKFITTEETNNPVTVNANILGLAEAILLTDGATGQFHLKAQLATQTEIAVSDTVKINNNRNHILDVIVDQGTDLKANGTDVITIHCNINKNLVLDKEYKLSLQHNVIGGKFLNTTDSNSILETLTQHANTYQLKVGLTPGNYDVTVKIEELGISTNKQVAVRKLDPAEVITIDEFDTNNILADGASIINGKLTIDNTTLTKIKMSSTGGSLLLSDLNNVVLNSNNKLDFDYKMGTGVEMNKITFTVPHPTPIEHIIEFMPMRSYPDDIFMELNHYIIDSMALNTTVVDVSVSTRKTNGMVSTGTPVTLEAFQVIDSKEEEVGQFENDYDAKTDTNGDVKGIKFRPLIHTLENTNDIIFIRATVLNQTQDSISTISEILINK
ncbi:MAG: hypothetical protein P1U56_25915 [Saprospiraceae bacterium]|nr:hypothetical protein [Saprospiraceae bacterium]